MKTHNHPNTIAAGVTHKPSVSRQNRRAICEYVANRGPDGAIDEEILRNCPTINANALRLRLAELRDDYKFITEELGERRRNAEGNMCRVWHVKASGLRALGLDPETHFHADKGVVKA